jgi:hypothetical protein
MTPLSKQGEQRGSKGHSRITFRFWPLGPPEAYPEQNGIVERFFRSLKGGMRLATQFPQLH